MLSVTLAAASFLTVTTALIFPGPCPKIKGPPFTCENEFGSSKKFYVMAHLPTTNQTLNFFYTAAEDLQCLQATLNCYGDADTDDEKLLSESTMFIVMERLFLDPMDEVPVDDNGMPLEEYVSPIILAEPIDIKTNDGATVYYPEYYQSSDNCTGMEEKMWTNMTVVKSVRQQYTVLWGCHELPDGKHEEGAWILGHRKNYAESKAQNLKEAFKILNDFKSPATSKDFIINEMSDFSYDACPKVNGMGLDTFATCTTGM